MPNTYFVRITTAGLNALAAALASPTASVVITKLGVGDGGGAAITPAVTDIALTRERYKTSSMNEVITDPSRSKRVLAGAFIPQDHSAQYNGTIVIREIGLYFEDGGVETLFARGSTPPITKPLITDGTGIDLYIRAGLEHDNIESITIQVDPNVSLITQTYGLATFVAKFGDIMTGKLKTAGLDYAYSLKSADFTVVDTDQIIELDASSGNGSIEGTLLDATSYPGKVLEFKAIDVTNVAKLTPNSGQSIGSLGTGAAYTFTNTDQMVSLYSDSYNWKIRWEYNA